MKKQMLLSVVAIVVGLSACNDETLPTEGQGNLLKNSSDAVLLEDSEYGTAFEDFYTEALGDTIKAFPPYVPYIPPFPRPSRPDSGKGYVHENDLLSGNWSRYKPPSSTHISEGTDKSKYIPTGGEHFKEGDNKSRYKIPGTVHIEDEHNRSKYKPTGSEHIKDGVNATKYKPVNWVHFGGPPSIDNTKYLPPGYVHIATGADESKYYKPAPAGQ